MEGWIKLHRRINKHWIWKDPIKLKWWLDILLTVNHEPGKVNIGFELYDCNKGQSVMSLKTWGERWSVNKNTVRNFFNLLEKDGMITHENLTKTTRITVCNYDSYQVNLHDEQTMSRRRATDERPTSDPNKNDKNDKKKEYPKEILELNEKCKKYFDEKYINESSLECFDKLVRIDGYTIKQIKQAILNARSEDFWIKNFQSPLKLRQKDKSGVMYIDIFIALSAKINKSEIGQVVNSNAYKPFNR